MRSHGSAVHVPFEFGGQRPRLGVDNPIHMLVTGASSCSPVLPIAQQPNNYIHSQSDFEAKVTHEHTQENELDPDEDSVAALPSTDEENATNDDARLSLQVTEEFGKFRVVSSRQTHVRGEDQHTSSVDAAPQLRQGIYSQRFPQLENTLETTPGS
jgi:hypothetical protein